MDADRPERAAALEYLRRKVADAPVARPAAGLRSTFQKFEPAVENVPEALRTRRLRPGRGRCRKSLHCDAAGEETPPVIAELSCWFAE